MKNLYQTCLFSLILRQTQLLDLFLDGEKVAVAKSSAKDASVTTADFAKFTLKSSKSCYS